MIDVKAKRAEIMALVYDNNDIDKVKSARDDCRHDRLAYLDEIERLQARIEEQKHEMKLTRENNEALSRERDSARATMAEEAAQWHLQSQTELLAKSETDRRCPVCERPPQPNESSRGGWCSNPFHEAGSYRARAAEHGTAAGFIRSMASLPSGLIAIKRETIERIPKAIDAMKESLGEYVRQSLYTNPEWSGGFKMLDAAVTALSEAMK